MSLVVAPLKFFTKIFIPRFPHFSFNSQPLIFFIKESPIITAVRLFLSCEGVCILLRRITFQVSLSDGDSCSLIAFEEESDATESGFTGVAA